MSADVDLATAIVSRISSMLTGGLQSDVLTGAQDSDGVLAAKQTPYGNLDVMPDQNPDHNTSGARIEKHKVTISVWGTGRVALGTLISQIRQSMESGAWSVPNTEAVMAIYPQAGMGAIRDEQGTKAGERLLKATIPYQFWLDRRTF